MPNPWLNFEDCEVFGNLFFVVVILRHPWTKNI